MMITHLRIVLCKTNSVWCTIYSIQPWHWLWSMKHHSAVFLSQQNLLTGCQMSTANGQCLSRIADVDKMAETFPPCMFQLHVKLRRNHRLRHMSRVSYLTLILNYWWDIVKRDVLRWHYSIPFHHLFRGKIANMFKTCRTWKEAHKKNPTNWLGQAKYRTTKIRPKAVGSGIFGRFFFKHGYADWKQLVTSYLACLWGWLSLKV